VFAGRVTQVSPVADPVARLIPVEVTIPNPGGQIGTGLKAGVSFTPQTVQRVVIPESAVQVAEARRGGDNSSNSGGSNSSGSNSGSSNRGDRSSQATSSAQRSQSATIFIVKKTGDRTVVEARSVQLGDRADNQVEVLSGLKPGEQFVVRSSGSLKAGDPVRLSFISETAGNS
jgi:HlyD family secretion protein